ncbi:MAG: aminopeptidase P family protein [Bacteriovoracaceae bacterium]|nr:aminopeptidase P family protein [Bacteriovoracaceae bacterium]
MERFVERRKRLLSTIEEGIIFIPSEELKIRSNDTQYPFRQNSNFLYLTGFTEPNSLLVLSKAKGLEAMMIFVHKRDSIEEMWTAKGIDQDTIKENLRLTEVYDTETMDEVVPELLKKHCNVYLDLYGDDALMNKLRGHCRKLKRVRKTKGHKYPQAFIDIVDEIAKMRAIKDGTEVSRIKKAISLSKRAHLAAMAYAGPGRNEHDVAALLEFLFKAEGGSGPAYASVVAGGDNINTLHYSENDKLLIDGQLMLIDAGAEFDGYASDVTRTFPVNGKFSDLQRDIYSVALKSQESAIAMIRPGVTLHDVHNKAMSVMIEGLIELDIFGGTVEDVIESKQILHFSPHRTCHWLGLDVHDVNPHLDHFDNPVLLEPGMVIAVEPGLYFPKSGKYSPTKYRGMGVRIEDNILVTKDGHKILTKGIPKTIDDIERACAEEIQELVIP